MKKIILLLTFIIGAFTFFINTTYASCLYDPNNPQPCNDTPGFLPNNYCSYTNITGNLWLGNWNNNRTEVRTLQYFLFNYYGVSNEINATGFFGRLTKNYVAKFQQDNSVYPVTGGVGPLTRNKMKSLCGAVGGDRDEHGCIGSAGYTWCAVKNKCLRSWEESCGKQDDSAGGANCKVYFDGCNTCSRSYVGGPAMCTLMACIQGGDAAWFAANQPVCREYFNQ